MYRRDDKCLAKVDEDEPIFVLRAQDRLAPALIREWVNRAKQASSLGARRTEEALQVADAMEEWQKAHPGRVKYPD